MCFDTYCPGIQKSIPERVCPTCGEYFVTKVALKSHKQAHPEQMYIDEVEDDFLNPDDYMEQTMIDEEDIYLIHDLHSWMTIPFEDVGEESESELLG